MKRCGALGINVDYLFECCSGEVATFDGNVAQKTLLVGLLEDVLLDRLLTDESVDVDVARLADTMAPILCLGIHRRVPIRVVKDDRVGASQVNADAAGTRRQNEAEDAPVGVEALHEHLTLVDSRRAVQSQVDVAVVIEESLEHVEHASHLGEDEHAVLVALELAQELFQCLQFAAVVLDEARVGEVRHHGRLDRV